MKTRSIQMCLGLVMAMVLGAPAAHAHDPDPAEVAQRCIQRMAVLTQRCVQRNAINAAHCVQRIETLLEAGEVEAAFQAGQRCAVRITQRTNACSAVLELICGRCTLFLVSHGAPGLAQLVQNACAEAVGTVQSSREAALEAIQNALPDPGQP